MDVVNVLHSPAFAEQLNKSPLVLVDIGARGGPSENWQAALPNLQVIGFEPDAEEHARLQESAPSNERYLNAALWREPSNQMLNLTRGPGSSSILEPNLDFLRRFPDNARYEVVDTETLETDTLDRQLSQNGIVGVDFLKIDTQGTELSVIDGATSTLDSVLGIELEVEFAEVYKGQPLFSDVDSTIRSLGFSLFDLRPHYWKRTEGAQYGRSKGQIIFTDALYLRSPEGVAGVLSHIEDDSARDQKLAHALAVCTIYGYVDYALEILEVAGGTVSAGVVNDLKHSLISNAPGRTWRAPSFRGCRRIRNLFYSLYEAFRSGPRWADSARTLGNL
jgi:FkbM family methyltransferase